jgi:trimethylamine--corrinoid protein Co-methyltransferase
VSDNNSYEQWKEEGSEDATKRANKIWKNMLHQYQAPALDEAKDEALQAYIAKRKASFPDSKV